MILSELAWQLLIIIICMFPLSSDEREHASSWPESDKDDGDIHDGDVLVRDGPPNSCGELSDGAHQGNLGAGGGWSHDVWQGHLGPHHPHLRHGDGTSAGVACEVL